MPIQPSDETGSDVEQQDLVAEETIISLTLEISDTETPTTPGIEKDEMTETVVSEGGKEDPKVDDTKPT